MDLKEVRIRQRVRIWLLAQVGFWAGRWVGRREAREAMANHQFFYPMTNQSRADLVNHRNMAQLHSRAEAMLKAGYTVYEVCDALGVPQGKIRERLRPSEDAQKFAVYVKERQSEGLTEAQIAKRLGISPWELRAVFSWAMSENSTQAKE